MLDGDKLKFGDLLVEKGKEYNPFFMFLSYAASRSNVKLLKIPRDIYIPSAPVCKPDYESFLDSRYVRDHGFYRNISIMDYANPDQIKKHNDKANPNLDLGRWLYNCSPHPIDEWLDSDGAEKDALKFKNCCYIIGGRGNGKSLSALSQMKKYLEDHPDAKIVMPYHHGYSYFKELINSAYGCKKSQHDDMPDSIDSAIKEFDRKQREERLEKAKLMNEQLKRMLNNSHYGICWPSELIDTCERIDKYRERKEEEEMEELEDTLDHKFTCHVKTALSTIVRLKFIRNRIDPGIAYTVFVHYNPLGELDHALNYKTWEELSSRLMYDVSRLISADFDPFAVDCFSEVIHKAKRVVKYCYCESKENDEEKTVKETSDMNGYKFMVPNGVFGSKVYIQAKDSDKITYAGTLTNMHLETASGCEMHGNVDFIVDDEPVERLANFNRGFIKNVIFHDPATIVEWKDGTKTVVQARDGEKFDPEKGLAMAISKKAMFNKRDYYNVFKHYLKKAPEQVSVCGEKVKTITIPEELADDVMQFLKEKVIEKANK